MIVAEAHTNVDCDGYQRVKIEGPDPFAWPLNLGSLQTAPPEEQAEPETDCLEFQPFTVTCVTCESRLRVARAGLVDAIVKCPKCQSMVQLSRPGDHAPQSPPVAMGNRPVDSNAITEDSIAADRPPLPPGHSSPQDGVPHQAPPIVAAIEPPPPSDVSAPTAIEQDGPQVPPPTWYSQKAAKSRRIALAVAVAFAGLISITLLIGALFRGSRDAGPVASGTTEDAMPQQVSVDSPPADSPPADSPPAAEPPPDRSSAEPSGSDPADGEEVASGESNASTENPNAPPTPAEPAQPAATDPVVRDAQPPADLLPQNPLLPSDPLADILSAKPPAAGEQANGSTDVAKLKELPEGLRELFGGLSDMERPQFRDTQPAPPTIDEFQVDRAADQPVNLENAVDEPDPINMRAAFGMQVAMQSADPAGYPLNDLMLVLGQLSGVPIEPEWVSLELCNISLTDPVPLPNGWPTLEAILKAACESIGGEYEMKARSVTVRPSEEVFLGAINELIDLSDFAEQQASAAEVARRLLGQTDGDPQMVMLPSTTGQQQIAGLVCEAIRRVRGRAGKLPDAIFSRWGGNDSDQVAAWPKLSDGVSGPPMLQPASVASLVRQIAKRNGATCFVNWRDGATAELLPGEQRMPRTGDDVSAAEALAQLLQPAGLQVRVVDRSHWWIGSQASFDRFPVVVWFDKQQDAESTRSSVQAILDGASAGGEPIGAVAVDPVSQTCLAVMPRFLLRQMPRLLNEVQ